MSETARIQLKLSPIQTAAQKDWQDGTTEILYDGAARSGKTWWIIFNIITRAIQFPGSDHLVCRYRGTHLKATVWRQTLLKMINDYFRGAVENINHSDKLITFRNGSTILGLPLEEAERITSIMGSEFATVFVNEAVQISYPVYQAIKTRCVQRIEGLRNKVIIDCNPTNQFHWIHRYFIQLVDPDKPTEKLELQPDQWLRRRGPWLPTDNHALSKEGVAMLRSLTGVQRERLYQGLWVSQEGLVFPDFDQAIVEPFQLPGDVEISAAVDFGYSNPFVFLWYAKHWATETYYLIDEYYQTEKTVNEHVRFLKRYRPSWTKKIKSIDYDFIIADHDPEDAATLAEGGFYTMKADKDIKSGIDAVRDIMAAERGWKLRIFRSCTKLISEMSSYRYPDPKGTDKDEVPVKRDDHGVDANRYWVKHVAQPAAAVVLGRL